MAKLHLRRTHCTRQGQSRYLLAEDESLEDSANLPDPDVLAAEIVEDLRSALTQFEGIAEELGEEE